MQVSAIGNKITGFQTNMCIALTETVAETIVLRNEDETPIDITNYSIAMQINFTDEDGNVNPLLLDTDNGGITINSPATDGAFTINVADTDTANFPVGSFSYDLFATTPDDVRTQILNGLFITRQNVTPIP